MKKIIFFLALLINSGIIFSQSEQIPEGWDKIIMEGEVAYMNLLTGDISSKLPKGVARKTRKVNSYTTSGSSTSSSTSVYYAKSGDTFSKIARENNISLSELYRLNNLDNFDKLQVGQEVIIGGNNNGGYHTVESNETLYSISQSYGISVNDLKNLNSLDSNKIIIGQRLRTK